VLVPDADLAREHIVITRYWPATGRARTHVGLGVPRTALLGGIGLPAACLVVLPILINARQPWLIVALTVAAIVPSRLMVRSRQFYALDEQGRAVRRIGPQQPERVRGKRGLGRRRFLATVQRA
jgi:hypothetical protein